MAHSQNNLETTWQLEDHHSTFFQRRNLSLSIGDVVNRHLMDGDFVLFNRQPSLHKMSMTGHSQSYERKYTFRLNVSVILLTMLILMEMR